MSARVVLAGGHGYGRSHRENLRRLARLGIAELVGLCDLHPVPDDLPTSASLPALIEAVEPDAVVVCTPIPSHLQLALTALRAGCAVLLEKPPVATLAQYRTLLAEVAAAGVPCQVGFQSLGSEAVDGARELIAQGRIGQVTGIGGAGSWIRDAGYFSRASWAGRRRLGGVPVSDGALSNPFAHLVATGLALAGARGEADVRSVDVELFHAYDIEADDTATARIRTAAGIPLTVAVTLAARRHRLPFLVVHGSHGRLVLRYTRDLLTLHTAAGRETHGYRRHDLLTDLVARLRDPGRPLLVPPERTGAFMRVLEAVRLAPEPLPIPAGFVAAEGAHRRVAGVDEAVLATATTLRTFAEQGVPWARGLS